MSVRQFAQSLSIIRRVEDTSRGGALMRHLMWQGRKLLFPRPVARRLSQSVITDDEAGGVISMVNMLGRYDFNNMHLVQVVLSRAPAPVFLDVGANIGAYTLIASEVHGADVISFEPIPAAFAKLERNVHLNGRERVTMLPVAVGREQGELRMTCNGASPINHVVTDASETNQTMVVAVETLDAVCERLGLSPTMIKIDVEGHEPAVLEGASACFNSADACLIENGDRPSVVSIMHGYGWQGPFYYHHRAARLATTPQSLAEDQVFIGPGFRAAHPAVVIDA